MTRTELARLMSGMQAVVRGTTNCSSAPVAIYVPYLTKQRIKRYYRECAYLPPDDRMLQPFVRVLNTRVVILPARLRAEARS